MREENLINNSLVSIVTVSFNSEKTIRDTFESILNQSYKNIEYLVIDGASKDRTVDIIKEYENKFIDRNILFRWFSEKDNGIYDAMNKGIDLANGEIIGLLNSDDWFEKDALEKVVKEYEKSNFDVFYADIRVIMKDKSFIKKSKLSKNVTSRYWNHPTTFVKNNIYKKYKFKCESIHDDLDFLLRIRKNKNLKIVVLNEVLANFRFGGVSNKKSLKNMLWNIKNKNRIYKENEYSPFYFLENTVMEFFKYILG